MRGTVRDCVLEQLPFIIRLAVILLLDQYFQNGGAQQGRSIFLCTFDFNDHFARMKMLFMKITRAALTEGDQLMSSPPIWLMSSWICGF